MTTPDTMSTTDHLEHTPAHAAGSAARPPLEPNRPRSPATGRALARCPNSHDRCAADLRPVQCPNLSLAHPSQRDRNRPWCSRLSENRQPPQAIEMSLTSGCAPPPFPSTWRAVYDTPCVKAHRLARTARNFPATGTAHRGSEGYAAN